MQSDATDCQRGRLYAIRPDVLAPQKLRSFHAPLPAEPLTIGASLTCCTASGLKSEQRLHLHSQLISHANHKRTFLIQSLSFLGKRS